jgi:hypothetical protein
MTSLSFEALAKLSGGQDMYSGRVRSLSVSSRSEVELLLVAGLNLLKNPVQSKFSHKQQLTDDLHYIHYYGIETNSLSSIKLQAYDCRQCWKSEYPRCVRSLQFQQHQRQRDNFQQAPSSVF